MSADTKYTIGRGDEVLGEFAQPELLRIYVSQAECEGLWAGDERRPLWELISEWHGAQSPEALRELKPKPKE